MAPSFIHMCKQCKWRHLVDKYATDVSGAILLPSSIQVAESISGSVVPLAMFVCICIFEKKQGPNISMIATDVIKCYQMTDTVHRACDLKPLCFSNISTIININHNHHKIYSYTFQRRKYIFGKMYF